MAIAAKATVLEELGFAVPRVLILEKERIGFNWTRPSGYTDGAQTLGTRPEKDLGFPIDPDLTK